MKNDMWKKGLVFGIIVLFVGAGIIPSMGRTVVEKQISKENKTSLMSFNPSGTTWYVDDDNTMGPWDGSQEHPFQFIRDGVSATSSGDTVFVYSGIYYEENLRILYGIKLFGEDKYSTIINNGGDSHCIISIYGPDCTVTGFTIQNAKDTGIYMPSVTNNNNNNISGNIIKNNGWGVFPQPGYGVDCRANNSSIYNNIFENNTHAGLFLFYYNNNIVNGNTFINNRWYGLWLCSSMHNIVFDNIFSDNGRGGILSGATRYNTIINNSFNSNGIVTYTGGVLGEWVSSNTIEDNTANGKPIRFYKNMSNVVVPTDTGQLILLNCNNFTIQSLVLSDVSIGIQLLNVTYSEIIGSTITDNSLHGILIFSSQFTENPLPNPEYNSNYNTISGNIIQDNYHGIFLCDLAINNSITENTIENNEFGIYIDRGSDYGGRNTLPENNLVRKNIIAKITLAKPSSIFGEKNTIQNNNLLNNERHGYFNIVTIFAARWKNNFWDRPRILPYIIFGKIFDLFSWINFDLRPAREQYDISKYFT